MYLDFIYRILSIILTRLCIYYADRFAYIWTIKISFNDIIDIIMRDFFHDDNENEAVEAYIPRHWDSKTKQPRHWDSKTKKPRHQDSKTKKPRHRETETNKPRHRDSKAFFQRTKSHDIKIPRLKNHDILIPRPKSHDIEFPWNSDSYAPWYI